MYQLTTALYLSSRDDSTLLGPLSLAARVFTPGNPYVVLQNMVEKESMGLKLASATRQDRGQRLQMQGGPAARGTADQPL